MDAEVEIAGSLTVLIVVAEVELSQDFIDFITFDDIGH